jgi:tetratricopeptide (TPR) repeat protein
VPMKRWPPRSGLCSAESPSRQHRERPRDPQGALTLLDQHRSRFPHGLLLPEAELTRLGALLEVGDRVGATQLLDRVSQKGYARSIRAEELRVLHGELLAEQGRCEEALDRFEPAAEKGKGGVHERALFGSSACRAQLGDFEGSRRDLERYLQRYPEGRFAAEARAALRQGR